MDITCDIVTDKVTKTVDKSINKRKRQIGIFKIMFYYSGGST